MLHADGTAGPIRSGEFVKVMSGWTWLSVPSAGGPVVGGPAQQASVFWIEKAAGSAGADLRAGDLFRIRGTDGDPWLNVPAGGGPVTGSPFAASLFVFEP